VYALEQVAEHKARLLESTSRDVLSSTVCTARLWGESCSCFASVTDDTVMILILERSNVTTRKVVNNDAKEEVIFLVIAAVVDRDG